jgi:phosphoglycerate dehydrogenase-like enzyme
MSHPIRTCLDPWTDGLIAMLAAAAPGERFVPWPSEEPSDVLVMFPGQDIAPALTGVRWVHALAAGVDRFPFEQLGDRVLTCSRGASAPAIAEFVLATMLAFEKQLPDTWVTEPPDNWNIAALGGLAGKTLGLVGVGAIGTEVARRALAFDMRVVAYRRRPDAPAPVEGVDVVAELSEVLGAADHVVVAAPATPETTQLIDAEAFAHVKPGVHLVNIARGSLVDQDALKAALDDGRVARASLDVVDPEPLPAGHWLYSHPKVRLSPHVSWSAPGTMDRTITLFVENLARYRAGEPLVGVVDAEAGY